MEGLGTAVCTWKVCAPDFGSIESEAVYACLCQIHVPMIPDACGLVVRVRDRYFGLVIPMRLPCGERESENRVLGLGCGAENSELCVARYLGTGQAWQLLLIGCGVVSAGRGCRPWLGCPTSPAGSLAWTPG